MLDDEINSEDSDQDGEVYADNKNNDDEEIPSVLVPIFNKQKHILGYTRIDKDDEYKLKGLNLIQAVSPCGYTAVLVTPFKQKLLPLSHFLTGIPPEGLIKDHINRNSFDNRKRNLRNATISQQVQNIDKKENCYSIYKGVTWLKTSRKWTARASLNSTSYHFGYSDDELTLAKAYDKFVLYYYKENARTNDVLSQEEKLEALTTPPSVVKRKEPQYGTGITKPFLKYIAQWVDLNGKQKILSFEKLEDAVAMRESKVQEVIDEKLHLLVQEVIQRDENGISIIKTNKTRGKSFDIKVDEKLYYRINMYNWNFRPGKNPTSTVDGKKSVKLPDLVLSIAGKTPKPGETIDHIYHDHTDCRLSSLRYATKSQQCQNRRKLPGLKRKYIGVQQAYRKFTSQIQINYKPKFIGSFNTELEAAQAYDKAVDVYYPGGMKNFPNNQ